MENKVNTKICGVISKNKKRIIIDFDGIYISVKINCKLVGDFVTVEYIGDIMSNTFSIVSVY
jgi:hypothetical protein